MFTVTGYLKLDEYRKNSKNWDTLNYYLDCPTNGIVEFYSAIFRSKDADRITNRVDTDYYGKRQNNVVPLLSILFRNINYCSYARAIQSEPMQ